MHFVIQKKKRNIKLQIIPIADNVIARYNTVKEAYAALKEKDGDEM